MLLPACSSIGSEAIKAETEVASPAEQSIPSVQPTYITVPTSVASSTPAPTSQPSLALTLSSLELVELPLAELSADAQDFVESREGGWGVAVIVPSQHAIYTANGDQLMSMASVVKVAIMVTVMDNAIREDRQLTDRELELLSPMITASDNDATHVLWYEIGGGAMVETYLRSIGITDVIPSSGDTWGDSLASAKAVAMLFAQLAFGEILDEPRRELALGLLADVIPSQRWGVTAGIPEQRPPKTVIGLKDGWYPDEYGWLVNSAGILIPGDDRPAYTIAVLTREQPSWEYGIATIEGVAERVHTALHGDGASVVSR